MIATTVVLVTLATAAVARFVALLSLAVARAR